MDPIDKSYVCTLDEASLKKAKEELKEDPKERLGALKTFRDWVKQQPHLCCPLSTEFLLPFLRNAKFSQLNARTKLESFLSMRAESPDWFQDIDMTKKEHIAFLKSGYVLPLPKRDSQGRKIMFLKMANLDPECPDYTPDSAIRTMQGLITYLNMDENTQVNGLVYFIDAGNMTLKHQTYWNMDKMRKMTKYWQGNYPIRFKSFNYYNIGPIFEALWAVFSPLLGKKFRDRIRMHGNNLEEVYKVIPMELLPSEYLPDDYPGESVGTIQECIDSYIKEISKPEVVAYIKEVHQSKYRMDKSKKPADVEVASFKKLNID